METTDSEEMPFYMITCFRRTLGSFAVLVICGFFFFLFYTNQGSWQAPNSPIERPGWLDALKNGVTFSATRVSEKTAKYLRNTYKPNSLSSPCRGGPHFSEMEVFESSVYICSAFLWNNSIRIIALKKRDIPIDGLVCTIRLTRDRRSRDSPDGQNSGDSITNTVVSVVKAAVSDTNDYRSEEYSAAYITCPLQKKAAPSPHAWHRVGNWSGSVSLSNADNVVKTLLEIPIETDQRCLHEGNKDVTDTDGQNKEQYVKDKTVEFTVCSSILRRNFGDVSQLVEKIEMSRILGAGRVVFYNSSVTYNVDAVLRWYAREWAAGRETVEVVVMPWHLPGSLRPSDLYSYGQVAAVNDCLNRYRPSSTYIVFTGLDQHIVPRRSQDWSTLISQAKKKRRGLSGFLLYSMIFRHQWPRPAESFKAVAEEYKSAILGHTQRENCTSPERIRARMIVDPKATEEMGIDFALRISGAIYDVVFEDGILQEYREALSEDQYTESQWKKCSTPVTDTHVVDVFGEQLAARLKDIWSKIGDKVQKDAVGTNPSILSQKQGMPVRPGPIDRTPQFHLVEGGESLLLVYAAIREGGVVRIIAIKTRGESITGLRCVFYSSGDQSSPSFTTIANTMELEENHGARHTAACVKCPIQNVSVPVTLVGLVYGADLASFRPKVVLPIENIKIDASKVKGTAAMGDIKDSMVTGNPEEEQKVEFSLCVPALYDYKNAAQLVEKIEMSRLQGVGRIVLYNNSVSSNVDAVLRWYVREWTAGRDKLEIKVYPWHFPRVDQDGKQEPLNIFYFGEMAAIDHCLHRYRHLSRYIMFTDMDEFFIPLRHDNLSQLIAKRRKNQPQKIGFQFRSTLFKLERPSPARGFEAEAAQFGSVVLGHTVRDKHFYPANLRSKLIVDPTRVKVMGIHFIWRGAGFAGIVPINQGIVAHYREQLECRRQVNDTRVSDKYGKRLVLRLRSVWSQLKGVSLGSKPVKKVKKRVC